MATLSHPPPASLGASLSADELAIARSVIYASLFDYPLTLAQLRQTLIQSTQTPSEILATYARSEVLQRAIVYEDGYFSPRGRKHLAVERRRREARSRAFLRRHRLLLALIAALPYVRMVALSGSIAHLNLDDQGDLDLFVVARSGRVWTITVAIVVLAKLLGRRRTLCANFVIGDTRLELEQQDLFSASQIIHLQPLVGGDVYRRLLEANPFVRRFYPNFHRPRPTPRAFHPGPLLRGCKQALEGLFGLPTWLAEGVVRRLYRRYLLRRSAFWQSPEQVRLEPDYVKLHTQSHRRSILDRFERALHASLEVGDDSSPKGE